jgi:hypothetical protein
MIHLKHGTRVNPPALLAYELIPQQDPLPYLNMLPPGDPLNGFGANVGCYI